MQTKKTVTEKDKIVEKRHDMGFFARIAYIWEYYKFYFIGGLLLLVISFNLVNTLVLNPSPKTYLSVAVFGPSVSAADMAALAEDMTAQLVPTPSPDEDAEVFRAVAESYHITGADAETSATMTQKLIANVSVGEVDLIITDEENFRLLANLGIFKPLSEVFNRETLGLYADDLYRLAPSSYDAEQRPVTLPEDDYGVWLDDNAYLASFGLDTSGMLLGVVPMPLDSEHNPNATLDGLRLILGE